NELRTMTCRLPSVDEFHEVYTLASLQRIMQALGAFSFLSRTKGKTWFEQFIPTGVHNLATMLRGRTDFPVLRALAQQILEKMDGRW
ncbi:MAG TPA: hypothetical protein PLG17_02510, partial [Thermodesulfobacteriota bacterium]|nr:hypothetical protein [Thermodesulfobacteriota bacterium]